jgi:hypothetical protein
MQHIYIYIYIQIVIQPRRMGWCKDVYLMHKWKGAGGDWFNWKHMFGMCCKHLWVLLPAPPPDDTVITHDEMGLKFEWDERETKSRTEWEESEMRVTWEWDESATRARWEWDESETRMRCECDENENEMRVGWEWDESEMRARWDCDESGMMVG